MRINAGIAHRNRIEGVTIGIRPGAGEILRWVGVCLIPNGCNRMIRGGSRPRALVPGDEREKGEQEQGKNRPGDTGVAVRTG
jgi:hypothetical protein